MEERSPSSDACCADSGRSCWAAGSASRPRLLAGSRVPGHPGQRLLARDPLAAGPLYRTLPSTDCPRRRQAGTAQRRRAGATPRWWTSRYADAVNPGILNALPLRDSEFIETQSFSILPRRDAMRALELGSGTNSSPATTWSRARWPDGRRPQRTRGRSGSASASTTTAWSSSAATLPTPAAAPRAIGAVGESSSPADGAGGPGGRCRLVRPDAGQLAVAARAAKLVARLRGTRQRPQLRRGKRDGNPWGEALALLRTPSGQPFYLNLHSSLMARTRATGSCRAIR